MPVSVSKDVAFRDSDYFVAGSKTYFIFLLCTFQILRSCQGRRTGVGVGVTTVYNSLILGGWVTKVLKNSDKK